MRTLILGMAPHQPTLHALTGQAGKRLARLAGLEALSEAFDTANLCRRPRPSWSLREAREDARQWCDHLGGRRVVLLGISVARAFDIEPEPLMRWRLAIDVVPFTFAVVPHTSGRCRFWNDPANVEELRDLITREAERSLRASGGRRGE